MIIVETSEFDMSLGQGLRCPSRKFSPSIPLQKMVSLHKMTTSCHIWSQSHISQQCFNQGHTLIRVGPHCTNMAFVQNSADKRYYPI